MAQMTDSSPFPTAEAQQGINGHIDNDVLMADGADNQAAFTTNMNVRIYSVIHGTAT